MPENTYPAFTKSAFYIFAWYNKSFNNKHADILNKYLFLRCLFKQRKANLCFVKNAGLNMSCLAMFILLSVMCGNMKSQAAFFICVRITKGVKCVNLQINKRKDF